MMLALGLDWYLMVVAGGVARLCLDSPTAAGRMRSGSREVESEKWKVKLERAHE